MSIFDGEPPRKHLPMPSAKGAVAGGLFAVVFILTLRWLTDPYAPKGALTKRFFIVCGVLTLFVALFIGTLAAVFGPASASVEADRREHNEGMYQYCVVQKIDLPGCQQWIEEHPNW